MVWTVRGSNSGAGKAFYTREDRSYGPPNLMYDRYRVSFPGVKRCPPTLISRQG